MTRVALSGLAAIAVAAAAIPAAAPRHGFDVVPLGVEGGILDGATSAYFIAPHGEREGVTCDAGTLAGGIRAALAQGAFPGETSARRILERRIRGYLITHGHLDHVAGLVLVSPDDIAKPIYALPQVNAVLADSYFNGRAWPNMANRGAAPALAKYRYHDLVPGGVPVPIEGTTMTLLALPLAHAGTVSTAFLLQSGKDALLCMGDTGADAVERSSRLSALWTRIAPLIRQRRLRGIIVETSYADPRPQAQLYGHLTPRWLTAELHRLAAIVGEPQAMAGLPVVIGHVKPSLDDPAGPKAAVMRQLNANNILGVRYIGAAQGKPIDLVE